MGKFINPEYKVVNDTNYLPFEYKTTGKGNSPSSSEGGKSSLGVVKNQDGSNGVSLYNDTELVVKTTFSDNVELNYDSDLKVLDVLVKQGDDIKPGTGIKMNKDFDDGKKVVRIDEEYLDTFVVDHSINKLRGTNGVLIEDDEEVENGKIVKLDDDYIIKQGEY